MQHCAILCCAPLVRKRSNNTVYTAKHERKALAKTILSTLTVFPEQYKAMHLKAVVYEATNAHPIGDFWILKNKNHSKKNLHFATLCKHELQIQ